MNEGAVSLIFFSETFPVAPDQTSQSMFQSLPNGKRYADHRIDSLATGYLLAVLESICAGELQPHLDHSEETVISSSVQCRHRAPIPPGALVTVNGWVSSVGNQEVTFWVQASDEQEIVCEGHIRLSIVHRAQIERKMKRKREAIDRRELFAAA